MNDIPLSLIITLSVQCVIVPIVTAFATTVSALKKDVARLSLGLSKAYTKIDDKPSKEEIQAILVTLEIIRGDNRAVQVAITNLDKHISNLSSILKELTFNRK